MLDQAQLADWGRLWAGNGGPGRDRDLAAVIRTGLGRVPSRWLGLRLDLGKTKILTFAMLFQRRTGLVATDAWQAAAGGDPSGVALLCLLYDLMMPRLFTWGDFLAKAYSTDHDPGADYPAWLDPPGTALGSPLSLLFFGGGPGWPPAPAPQPLRQLHRCGVESLLVSGELDVSTPPQHAHDEALPHLPRGSHVIIPNASHVDDSAPAHAPDHRRPDCSVRLPAGGEQGRRTRACGTFRSAGCGPARSRSAHEEGTCRRGAGRVGRAGRAGQALGPGDITAIRRDTGRILELPEPGRPDPARQGLPPPGD